MLARSFTRWFRRAAASFLFLAVAAGCTALDSTASKTDAKTSPANTNSTEWPSYPLQATQTWKLNLPQGKPFDASGLLFQPNGTLLTVDNRAPGLHRVQFTEADSVTLSKLPDCFTRDQLKPFAKEKVGIFDFEGIARDAEDRLYVCEEGNRWILRWDPRSHAVERLPIDWSSVTNYFSDDRNASFEGLAIGNGKLYVINERTHPVIITVDLRTLEVEDHFVLTPRTPSFLGILHYSDLSWFDNSLWVLCRQHRVVLQVDPRKHQVLAEFNYGEIERSLGYQTRLPGIAIMEGLAVDKNFIWLLTDNNGLGTFTHPKDNRPTLLKCPRPDRKN